MPRASVVITATGGKEKSVVAQSISSGDLPTTEEMLTVMHRAIANYGWPFLVKLGGARPISLAPQSPLFARAPGARLNLVITPLE